MEFFTYLKKEYKPLLLIFILFLINLFLFNNKMINVHTDFGREVYFSALVSKGAVLYRDMFNTFLCPFSYLLNGLLLKIFPVNLNTFYLIGAFNAFVILMSVYFISRNFLSRLLSTVIPVFVMYWCCFYAGLMNFLMPYSYAVVYGLSACLLSVLLYLNYLRTDRNWLLYLSFFFAGVSASNKYEYILYALFLVVFSLFQRKKDIKSLLFLLPVPVLSACALIVQGLKFSDIKNYFEVFSSFIQQPYLKKVYEATFYFNPDSLIYLLFCFVIAGVIFFLAYKFFEKKSTAFRAAGFLGLFAIIGSVLFSFKSMNFFSYDFLSFTPLLISVLAALRFKKIIKDRPVLFLVLASLIISTKSFWMLLGNFYGRYFLPLLIVSLIVILKKYYFENENVFSKTVCFILIFLSFASFRLNLISLVLKSTPVKTDRGTVFEQKETAENLNTIISFLQNNTSVDDTVVVLGGAPLLNFLSNRESVDFYNHYDEAIYGAYGSEKIINAYEKACPDYFVVNKIFCNSYGQAVCEWLNAKYKAVYVLKSDNRYEIFRKI